MHFTSLPALFFASIIAGAMPLSAMASSKVAQVVTMSGKVTMDAPGIAAKALANNDDVPEGAIIKTGPGSGCKLLFTDDTIMDVGAASEFKVDEFKPGDGHNRTGVFSLAYGTMRSLVSKPVGDKGSYKVKTRDAIMGVRGTEFAVSAPYVDAGSGGSYAGSTTSVVVASGTVAVASGASSAGGVAGSPSASLGGGTMAVTAGQSFTTAQFSSSGGGSSTGTTATALQPTAMNAGQVQTAMGSARVSDNSFTNAVSMDTRSESSGSGSGGNTSTAAGTASTAASPGGGPSGGNMTMASAVGAVAQTVSVGTGQLLSGMQLAMPNPNAIGMGNVITAPPVLIIPGAQRTLTITIQ